MKKNNKINIFIFCKKQNEQRVRLNNLRGERGNPLEDKDINKIMIELVDIKNEGERLSGWLIKYITKTELIILLISVLNILSSIIYIYTNFIKLQNSDHNINIEFYSVTATLIPVILVAIYFSNKNIFNSKLGALTELVARVIPAIIAIGACLYAIANRCSNGVIFYIIVLCLSQLALFFAIVSVVPAFQNNDN